MAPLVLALALLSYAVPAARAQPAPGPLVAIDGPSNDIVGLSSMSVARDGTGAVVYLKQVMGATHVFVSRLLGGTFHAPEEVDPALVGSSSQPVVAAGNGGLLLVAFINAGQLYVVDRPGAAFSSSAPILLAAGAGNPSLSISNFGKAYLAFTAAGTGGHDIRTAYYAQGHWQLEATPLDAQPADDAGVGLDRPRVAAAGDGVGIVVWGEAGHVYSRRVRGITPSVVTEQADVPSLAGWGEVSATAPSVAAGGDSSYAGVAFDEVLANGSGQQSRVLMRRLHGSQFDGVTQPDGLVAVPADGAAQPQVVMGEYGRGFVTSARRQSNQLYAMSLGKSALAGPVMRVDSLPNATAPDAAPALAGLYSDLIAWQHDSGGLQPPDIRLRYAPDGPTLGPELVVSTPGGAPPDADSGLVAAGDGAGDAVVSWVQGTGATTQIVARQLYQPPGSFGPLKRLRYDRGTRPLLGWSAAHDLWGPLQYVVTLDGVPVAAGGGTTLRLPTPLADGPHAWAVSVSNSAGLVRASAQAIVWVDSVAPVLRFSLSGARRVGSLLRLNLTYSDAPPGEPRSGASGIAEVLVNWGDGRWLRIRRSKLYAYKRTGTYKLTITAKDRAGNSTTLVRRLKIAASRPRGHGSPSRAKAKRPQSRRTGGAGHSPRGAGWGNRGPGG